METVSGMKLVDLLMTIQRETQPIDGHPDPKAINDCWNEVFETLNEHQKPAVIKKDHIGYYHEHDDADGLGYMLRLRFAPTTGGWHSLEYKYCPICGKELIKPDNL